MEDSCNVATIISRAGKATAKYPNCWNIKERHGTTKSLNLDRVHSWQCTETKSVNDVTEVVDANTIYPKTLQKSTLLAKYF